jgi:hypothetical protein
LAQFGAFLHRGSFLGFWQSVGRGAYVYVEVLVDDSMTAFVSFLFAPLCTLHRRDLQNVANRIVFAHKNE